MRRRALVAPAVVVALVLLGGSVSPTRLLAADNTIVVNRADDADICTVQLGCTLRGALNFAAGTSGSDRITFSIGSGARTIRPQSGLPGIGSDVEIDGTTQPGFAGAPLIELDGSQAGPVDGLQIFGSRNTIRGLVINRFRFYGIRITAESGDVDNVIAGNFIGTNAQGTAAAPNGTSGIVIEPPPVVELNGAPPASALVASASAQAAPPLPHSDVIGGDTAADRNVISGNTANGIAIVTTPGPIDIRGNYIGTNAAGSTAIGNGAAGVSFEGIGGTFTHVVVRNTISGNQTGIRLANAQSSPGGIVIQENLIGLAQNAVDPLGNSGSGIAIDDTAQTFIGGVGAGNAIRFNGGAGVAVTGESFSNDIVGNAISSNGGLGIDLGADGVTPNDPDDADLGPNDLQNSPTVTDFTTCAAGIASCTPTITGTLSSEPSSRYVIDLYDNAACDASGFGEGGTYLGSTEVTTDVSGAAPFTFQSPLPLSESSIVTATASNLFLFSGTLDGPVPFPTTSEFSMCRAHSADLALSKSASTTLLGPGDLLVFHLMVENHGPDPAVGATVTDPLPSGVTLVSATATTGTCAGSGTVTCTIAPLAPGDSAEITVTATAGAVGVLTNTATATAATPDPEPSNNTASASVTVASADLALTKTDAPDPVNLGEALTYTLTVQNAGPSAASGVRLTDTLAGTSALLSAAPSQGSCSGALVCELGTIPAGSQATVEIRVMPGAAGTLANGALVTSDTSDPNRANNSVSATTEVTSADLSLTKTDAPDPVTVRGVVVYTLTVANAGPSAAANVRVSDPLAAAATFLAATPGQGSCAGAPQLTCELGTIAAGGRVTIQVRAAARTAGTLTNVATVTSATHDPTGSNNSALATTRVTSADLAVRLAARPDPVTVGDRLLFTATVNNAGPTVAAKAVLTLRLPPGARPARGTRCVGKRTLRCALGTIRTGARVVVTAALRPAGAGPRAASAHVEGADFDPAEANNDARVSASARFRPQLRLAPAVGPPGFVTLAVGTGFPPATSVLLRWTPGLGAARARTDANGRIRTPMIVFQNDLIGVRHVVAAGLSRDPARAFAPVQARFLVVPGRLEPAGFVQRR